MFLLLSLKSALISFFLFIWAISASLDAYGAKVAEGCQNALP